jgi:hypothetical protein
MSSNNIKCNTTLKAKNSVVATLSLVSVTWLWCMRAPAYSFLAKYRNLPTSASTLRQVQRKIKVKIWSILPNLDPTELGICQNSQFDNPFLLFLHLLIIEGGSITKISVHLKGSRSPHEQFGKMQKIYARKHPQCTRHTRPAKILLTFYQYGIKTWEYYH